MINVRNYFIRLSVLSACVPTKFYYKYQMFLWWRLFSTFGDSLKILGGRIHFKLIGFFLAVERRWYGCSFFLLKLINRRSSRESHYNFVVAAGIIHPKSCVLFPIFFFTTVLPLSYRQEKFCTSSAICSSEVATGGVL